MSFDSFARPALVVFLAYVLGSSASAAAAGAERASTPSGGDMNASVGEVRIAFLHHSTGEIVWGGGLHRRVYRVWDRAVPEVVKKWTMGLWQPAGVPEFIRRWNAEHGTRYRIDQLTFPATADGYPWANYPYDYWNLWVAHRGAARDRGELNLDDLVARYDVVGYKHCFPVSRMVEDSPPASVSSSVKMLANYKLQYEALKERLHQFPEKRFIVWTGAPLARDASNPDQAKRAREFFAWVKNVWDEPGDNIFVWDFLALASDADGFLAADKAAGPKDSHPNGPFAKFVAPLIGRRIVDVIEGRGDTGSLTGEATAAHGGVTRADGAR